MIAGLTPDFLIFIGSTVTMLLLCPITLGVGYIVSLSMDWVVDGMFKLMGRR